MPLLRRFHFPLLLCCAGLWPAFASAAGESPLETPAARAQEFNFSAVVVSFENDKFFAGSDRHYTQGARITFLYDGGAQNPFTRTAQKVLEEVHRLLPLDSTAKVERGKLAASGHGR